MAEPFIVALLAFGLLMAALVAFLLSTRQMRLPMRAINWALGAALLAGSLFVISLMPAHVGLLRAIAESGAANSLLSQALAGNWRTVADAVPPMFDAFWAFGAAMALIALIALTPGDLVERFTRPLIYATAGACVGGFLALALVATGFGGHQKRQVFFTVLSEEQVRDGDTIMMGDLRLRLAGIDAPELDQTCLRPDGARVACGAEARRRLAAFVRGKLVICDNPHGLQAGPIRESYGRPVVSCRVRSGEDMPVDLAGWMIREGLAQAFKEERGAGAPDYARQERRSGGVWETCTLAPPVWRQDVVARRAFEEDGALPEAVDARLGKCPAVAAAPVAADASSGRVTMTAPAPRR